MNKRFKTDRYKNLKKDRLKGFSNRDLAKKYGVSSTAIVYRLKQIKFTKKEEMEIRKLTNETRITKFKKIVNHKNDEIQKVIEQIKKEGIAPEKVIKYNFTETTFLRKLKTDKKLINSKKARNLEEICRRLEAGEDYRKIASELNLSVDSIKVWLKDFGYKNDDLKYFFGQKQWINVLKVRNLIKNNKKVDIKGLKKELNVSEEIARSYIKEEMFRKEIIKIPDFSPIYKYFDKIRKLETKIIKLYEQGLNPGEISATTGYSISTIRRILNF